MSDGMTDGYKNAIRTPKTIQYDLQEELARHMNNQQEVKIYISDTLFIIGKIVGVQKDFFTIQDNLRSKNKNCIVPISKILYIRLRV